MAITVRVSCYPIDQAMYVRQYSTFYSPTFGTNTVGPNYEMRSSMGDIVLSNSKEVDQISGGLVNTYYFQRATAMMPYVDGTVVGYNGVLTFTAPTAGKVVVLQDICYNYNYDTMAALPALASFSAGPVSIPINDAAVMTNAIKYGLVVYKTDTDNYNHLYYLRDAMMQLTYTNVYVLPTVRAVSPVATSVLRDNETEFRWDYEHITGMPQTGWELHIVDGSANDTLLASGIGDDESCLVPADTLPLGRSEWYVKVAAAEEGESVVVQSDPVYIYVRGNPMTSEVSTDDKPHLTVSWTAANQQAAQVRVGDTTYPIIWTSAGSYTIPEVLSDGVYPVSVRTQTNDGAWSGWSETIYADIRNEPPSGAVPPVLSYTVNNTAVTLTWTAVGSAQAYVLYRNNVPIYAGNELIYTDVRACGFSEYKVRAVFSSGYYVESETRTLVVLPSSDILLYDGVDELRTLIVRHHPQYPVRGWDESSDTEFKYYAGRELPVAVSDGHISRALSLTAAYRSPTEAAALLSLLGKTVIYKSQKGESCVGVIISASRESSLTDAVTYRITATDDDERAWLT